ncbi:MAG: hypothetical protein ACR2NX_09185 [Chthoniobacterales bacterium]
MAQRELPRLQQRRGLHQWDDRLTDYAPEKIAERAEHVCALLEKIRGLRTENWAKDERIDWILFRTPQKRART